jgi:thioredoxin 1
MVAPFVERLSESDFAETAEFYKVDVDEVPEVAGSLGVTAVPTFFLFKDGKKVGQMMGANSSALKVCHMALPLNYVSSPAKCKLTCRL